MRNMSFTTRRKAAIAFITLLAITLLGIASAATALVLPVVPLNNVWHASGPSGGTVECGGISGLVCAEWYDSNQLAAKCCISPSALHSDNPNACQVLVEGGIPNLASRNDEID